MASENTSASILLAAEILIGEAIASVWRVKRIAKKSLREISRYGHAWRATRPIPHVRTGTLVPPVRDGQRGGRSAARRGTIRGMEKAATDIYTFKKLRESGFTYVDKTGLLLPLVDFSIGKQFFMARPRRFGKAG